MTFLSQTSFRTALSRFPAGVVVVTTHDADGSPHGFTASSFCSVSLDPPLVLMCLAESANSYPVFTTATRCAVSILAEHHTDLARRFATKGTDKFAGTQFESVSSGLPAVPNALCVLDCEIRQRHSAGDHVILVAEVKSAEHGHGRPMVYYDSGFRRLTA